MIAQLAKAIYKKSMRGRVKAIHIAEAESTPQDVVGDSLF